MHETLGNAGGPDGDSRVEVTVSLLPLKLTMVTHPSMHATLGSTGCAYVNLQYKRAWNGLL